MNIVRNRSELHGIGQFTDEPLYTDIIAETTPPDYTDPNITYGPGSGAPGSTAIVPKPPSSPAGFTFPPGTLQQLFPQGLPASPAPRVNIPTSTVSGFMSASLGGVPMLAWAGLGIVAVLVLSSGGRRRR